LTGTYNAGGGSFSGRYTDLDFSGTTGLSDGIDNVSVGGGGTTYNQSLNTTDDVLFNKISANDWSNVTINKSQVSDLQNIEYVNKWFVSQEIGDDNNTGNSESDAFKTIERAISECSVNDMVQVLDSAIYTLSDTLSIPCDVTLLMEAAGLRGEITLGCRSRIIGLRHLCSDDGQTMVTCVGEACSYYSMKSMTSIGYENIIHFKNACVNGHIMADIARIEVNSTTVGNGNIFIFSQAGLSGINIATDGNSFSSDKAINYGYASNLVYGGTGYAQWYTDVVGLPVTITYDDGNEYTVSSYKMKATPSGTRMPKNWVMQGQLSGGGWTTLDTQTGILWNSYEEKEFTVSLPSNYDEYRIVISLAAHSTRLQIDDIGFWAGVEGIGGALYLNAHYCLLGNYAKGILSHDVNQNIFSNINSVQKSNEEVTNETFIEISNGKVNHRGNFVNVTNIWNKTGGTLCWSVTKYIGNNTGVAENRMLTSNSISGNFTTVDGKTITVVDGQITDIS